jgi:DNA replication protein DnaC
VLTTAKAQRWDPAEAVRALLAEELAGRRASSINIRRTAAGFPTGKAFDTWEEQVSSIPAPTQRSLTTLEWVDRHENLVVCGPSGTGKTHLLEALGHAAIGHGCHVQWFSLETLAGAHQPPPRRRQHQPGHQEDHARGPDLHDIGLLPVATETAEALYRVVDAAYEKRSIALSSNLHPAGFDELMPKTIANATVDRLLHHAHVVITNGDSIRLTPSNPRQRGEGTDQLTLWADPLAISGQF